MTKLLCLSLFLASAAAQLVTTHAPREYFGDWKTVQRAAPHETVQFTVVVKEQNMDVVTEAARQVSDPDHPKYGQFFTTKQMEMLTMPAKNDFSTVFGWLKDLPYTQKHSNLLVSCTVREAEALLNTTFSVLASDSQGLKVIKAGDYALPVDVQFSIKAIFGLHGIPRPSEKPLIGAAPATVTPAVLAATYGIGGVTPARTTANRNAVAEFQGQLMSQTDLSTFFRKYINNSQEGDDTVYKYVGDAKQNGEGVEALLDIQYIMGVAVGVKAEFWEWKANDFCHDLNGWSSEILSDDDTPSVHSVSYGWQGKLSQLGCQAADQSTVEDNFAKIAAVGKSVIFASGDSGSGYTGALFGAHIYPSWPASSPWVTAVGGTRFIDQTVGQPEQATDQFGSGGGFSDEFNQTDAAWQVDAVKGFFAAAPAAGLPPSTAYSATGRATPDVSALGEGYSVIVGGRPEAVGGTSASTPAFAGMISLINDARVQAGKKPLGFLNPFLYKNADAFTDVTVGNNRIGRGGNKVKWGWDCTKGWDPVTGLGTPLFPKLLKAALALP